MTRYLIALMWVVVSLSPCFAFQVPEPRPLDKIISDSNVVLVGKIASFIPDKDPGLPEPNSYYMQDGKRHWFYAGALLAEALNRSQGPGTYTLRDVHAITGSYNGAPLSLPAILDSSYGRVQLRPSIGLTVLLLLTRNSTDGTLKPAEPLLPLIPLSATPQLPSVVSERIPDATKLQSIVCQIIYSSLPDPGVRQADTYILRNETGASTVQALAPYLNDPNIETRASVLYAMLNNQQVSCIPRAVALEHLVEDRGNGTATNTIAAFDNIQTPEAVEYFNPLLWDPYVFVRHKAMQEIGRLGNSSSIPYLMLAAIDPDPSHQIDSSALFQLERLCPWLTSISSTGAPNFEDVKQWWSDELNGRHVPRLWPNPDDGSALPTSADDLDKLVWVGNGSHRETVVAALRPVATSLSIPYLIVALFDPDNTVAYTADVTLSHLLEPHNPIPAPSSFARTPGQYTQPLLQWWSEELLGSHRSPPSNMVNNIVMPPDLIQALKAKEEAKDAAMP